MRTILAILILLSAANVQAAGDWRKDLKKNVDNFYEWYLDKLDDFPKTGNRNSQQVAGAGSYAGSHKSFNDYNKAAQSPYVKREFMDRLSSMSKELAKTAGTMLAPDSAQKLRDTAKNLKNSNDPDFQQIGRDFDAEAAAIERGDPVEADRISDRISSMDRPYVPPGYKPSSSENSLVNTFSKVIAGVFSNLGGVVGSVVINGLLNTLGVDSDSSAIGGAGKMVGSSAGKGDANAAGSSAIKAGGAAANDAINQIEVDSRKSMDSQNSGGAPSAK